MCSQSITSIIKYFWWYCCDISQANITVDDDPNKEAGVKVNIDVADVDNHITSNVWGAIITEKLAGEQDSDDFDCKAKEWQQ